MIIAIDILLGIAILVSVAVGIRQGFIRSVAGFLRYVIAYIAANALYPSVASLTRKLMGIETPSISDGKEGIIQFIKSIPDKISAVDTETAREMFTSAVIEVIVFIVIFFTVLFIIRFIAWIIEKSMRLPGLTFANRFLGGVFGAFCGLMWAWLLASLFSNYLLDFFIEKDPVLFYPEMRDNFLVKFCAENNPLAYLFAGVDALAKMLQI